MGKAAARGGCVLHRTGLRTLQLLYDAAKEFADQVYHGPQFMQETKTERKAQQQALKRARTKAVKTINTADKPSLTTSKPQGLWNLSPIDQ